MKKHLKKNSKVPNIDLVPDSVDLDLIKQFNAELLDEEKWVRFRLTGPNQGCYGKFGYWEEETDDKVVSHNYLVEMYAFQSAKSFNNMILYKTVFIIHELYDDKNLIGKSVCLDGGSEYPFTARNALSDHLDVDSNITIQF